MKLAWIGAALAGFGSTARADPLVPLRTPMFRLGAGIAVPDLQDGTESRETLSTGYSFEADALIAVTPTAGLGLHTSIAHFNGNAELEETPTHATLQHLTEVPVIIAATFEQRLARIGFVAPFFGWHANRLHDNLETVWESGIAYGGTLGVDIVARGGDRLAAFVTVTEWSTTAQNHAVFTLGLAYRR
jgi:hypothetical protein